MAKRTCPFVPGSHVWGYGRDSRGIEQQESVASQRKAIEEYCRQNDLVLVYFFADEARIGSTTVGRDALEDLLYLARREAQTVDGIINRTYLGIRKCGELEIKDAHEPLVSSELWDAVQATLGKRPKKGGRWPKGKLHPMRVNLPYFLSGLAYCPICGSAMVSGADSMSGNRQTPWTYYLCGRKKREGWHSCPSGKIGARGPEAGVLRIVATRVLTLDFVLALIAEANQRMRQGQPKVQEQIDETDRQLAEIERAIGNLLDLAERFGAASAGPRIAERDAERAQLHVRLRRLEQQQEARELTISPEMIQSTLKPMREALIEGDTRAKRDLLSKVVAKIVTGPTGAELSYTFPLHEMTETYTVPPWGMCRHLP